MSVHDALNFRTRLVDCAVDKSFDGRGAAVADGLTIQAEFHEVAALDQLGSEHPSHEESLGLAGMARTHVAIGIRDTFVRQDPVRNHEFVKNKVQRLVHGISTEFLAEASNKALAATELMIRRQSTTVPYGAGPCQQKTHTSSQRSLPLTGTQKFSRPLKTTRPCRA